MRSACIPLVGSSLLLSTIAEAQTIERFRLPQTERGTIRLDTATGAMSVCTQRGDQLVCRMATDERAAADAETDRLRNELAQLAKRVTALEQSPALTLPTEEDVNRSLGLAQQFLRVFAGIVGQIGNERGSVGCGSAPDRTGGAASPATTLPRESL